MKQKLIFLDTDIGNDCDDAAALVLLCNLELQAKIKLVAATGATTREGSAECIKAFAEEYGLLFPIGNLVGIDFMSSEKLNYYAKLIKEKAKINYEFKDSVKLFRKIATETNRKFTIIAIGPLKNIANFLKSDADNISNLNGVQLFKKSVSSLVVMGGCFSELPEMKLERERGEFNIINDIESAKFVAENCPIKTIFSPFELGSKILTGKNIIKSDKLCGLAFNAFYKNIKQEVSQRPSWDPITSFYGALGSQGLFNLSLAGKVTFNDNGMSIFTPYKKGNHYILGLKAKPEKVSNKLNSLIF